MAELKRRQAPFGDLAPLLEVARRVLLDLEVLPIPTLAAVNGPAAGAGLNLALACDLRVASDQASFGRPSCASGSILTGGGTYHLPRLVGLVKAVELCWTGHMIDAAEALRIGLVNRVVPHARLTEEVEALARRLADAPQASLRLVKPTLRAALHGSLEQCLAAETEAQEACWRTQDVAEGMRAFAEKRAPRFGAEPAATLAPPPIRFE